MLALKYLVTLSLLLTLVSSGDISPFSPPFLRTEADRSPVSTFNYLQPQSSSSGLDANIKGNNEIVEPLVSNQYNVPNIGPEIANNIGANMRPNIVPDMGHNLGVNIGPNMGHNMAPDMGPNLGPNMLHHNMDNPMYGGNNNYNTAHNPVVPSEYSNSGGGIKRNNHNTNPYRNIDNGRNINNYVHPHSPVPASLLRSNNNVNNVRETSGGGVRVGRPQLRQLNLESSRNRAPSGVSVSNRNPNRRNRSSNRVSEGHRLITRALWRIFDALMEKNEKVELQGRITFIEEAIKDMITSDSMLEGMMEMIKEENMGQDQRLEELSHKLDDMHRLTTRVAELESWQLTLERQKDEELLPYWNTKPAYTSCPSPFETVEGECFYVAGETKRSWQDARRDCSKYGGDLAAPHSLQSLRTYLQSLAYQPEYVWVGASRLGNGEWVWSVGVKEGQQVDMHYDTWNEDLPNGMGNCMGLYEGAAYRAYDYHCTEEDLYVCQFFLT